MVADAFSVSLQAARDTASKADNMRKPGKQIMANSLFPVLTILDDKVTVEELLMRRLGENGELLREKQWDDRIPLNYQ